MSFTIQLKHRYITLHCSHLDHNLLSSSPSAATKSFEGFLANAKQSNMSSASDLEMTLGSMRSKA